MKLYHSPKDSNAGTYIHSHNHPSLPPKVCDSTDHAAHSRLLYFELLLDPTLSWLESNGVKFND
jgi:hypothetical protein